MVKQWGTAVCFLPSGSKAFCLKHDSRRSRYNLYSEKIVAAGVRLSKLTPPYRVRENVRYVSLLLQFHSIHRGYADWWEMLRMPLHAAWGDFDIFLGPIMIRFFGLSSFILAVSHGEGRKRRCPLSKLHVDMCAGAETAVLHDSNHSRDCTDRSF